jgi:hypothetical protein
MTPVGEDRGGRQHTRPSIDRLLPGLCGMVLRSAIAALVTWPQEETGQRGLFEFALQTKE